MIIGFNGDRNLRYICKQSNRYLTAIRDFVQMYKIYTPGRIRAQKPGFFPKYLITAIKFGKKTAG
ncbi:MAG: hypothetical protein EAZ78_23530 [Oscillatoriales cyanobacterium]|nr:MAG: hypothetical protein EAZ78_23530 [Oscillatoriales cyanobacterium]TAF34381.1 MAG: hypothetical protein EAZ68_19120 [Oscillatoriales cyanobacterium]TAF69487.1 MAG: hypothetical protein EAZ59_08570 [Oscillatoriales cyanobacterium]